MICKREVNRCVASPRVSSTNRYQPFKANGFRSVFRTTYSLQSKKTLLPLKMEAENSIETLVTTYRKLEEGG
jgi:hypothetical protein